MSKSETSTRAWRLSWLQDKAFFKGWTKIHIIDFFWRKEYLKSWLEFFVVRRTEGLEKLLVGYGSTVQVDKVPMQEWYECAFEGKTDLDKKIFKQEKLKELAYEDFILIINPVHLFERLHLD